MSREVVLFWLFFGLFLFLRTVVIHLHRSCGLVAGLVVCRELGFVDTFVGEDQDDSPIPLGIDICLVLARENAGSRLGSTFERDFLLLEMLSVLGIKDHKIGRIGVLLLLDLFLLLLLLRRLLLVFLFFGFLLLRRLFLFVERGGGRGRLV